MNVVCLDMEGVVTPEIWIKFAEASGIPELTRTTRDEPDYEKLMKWRINLLRERGFNLSQIQEVISTIDVLDGAREFLDKLRSFTQVCIISDTFEQFAMPLVSQLGYPFLFCNELIVDASGVITGFKMRCDNTKLTTVKALQEAGCTTFAAGDSHNDLAMIRASKAGWLFRSTDAIKAANPDVPTVETYEELLAAIEEAMW